MQTFINACWKRVILYQRLLMYWRCQKYSKTRKWNLVRSKKILSLLDMFINVMSLTLLTNTMLDLVTFFQVAFYKTSKMMERLQRDLYKLLLRDCMVTWKQGRPYPSRHKNVVTTLLRLRCPTSLWRRHIVAMETSDDVAKTTSFYLFI